MTMSQDRPPGRAAGVVDAPRGETNSSPDRLYQRFLQTRAKPVELNSPAARIELPVHGPALIMPTRAEVDLVHWCTENAATWRTLLRQRGGVRFRGYVPVSQAHFERVFRAICPTPMDYRDRSSPRTAVGGSVYTSTDYPQDQRIALHCELSYSDRWPRTIAFFCAEPAASGGNTPLADTRAVLARLEATTRQQFTQLGVLYRRRLSERLGLSWRDVFGLDTRESIERECQTRGVRWHWSGHDELFLEWRRPAIIEHPDTSEPLWFNHALFYHPERLDPTVRGALGQGEALPFSAHFGDGTPIPTMLLEEIEQAYAAAQVDQPWVVGDILVLDNMLMAHGRAPFCGPRRVYVMMGDPHPPASTGRA